MIEKLKTALPDAIEFAGRRAPVGGVFAFSACSVHAVAHMLLDNAKHSTPLYWLAAALIELATAWLVVQIVGQAREATRSIGKGFAKQDRRFARIVLVVYIGLALPSFATSIAANHIEFNDWLLAPLFPVLTVACAVGAAMPGLIRERKQRKRKDTQTQNGNKATKAKDAQAQQRASWQQTLANLGKAGETLRIIVASPEWTRASIAQALDVSPQAISNHLKRLESAGLIDRANGQVRLPDGLAELLEGETDEHTT